MSTAKETNATGSSQEGATVPGEKEREGNPGASGDGAMVSVVRCKLEMDPLDGFLMVAFQLLQVAAVGDEMAGGDSSVAVVGPESVENAEGKASGTVPGEESSEANLGGASGDGEMVSG